MKNSVSLISSANIDDVQSFPSAEDIVQNKTDQLPVLRKLSFWWYRAGNTCVD